MDWLWPKISNTQEAEKAVLHSAMWAAFVAVLTCIVALVAILAGHPISGIDGPALFDGIIFAVIAWRLYRFSFGWAVFAVGMMTLEILWKAIDGAHLSVLSFIILAGFLSGVRGTFFLKKHHQKDEIIASQLTEIRKSLRLDEEMPPSFGETQTWLDKRVSEELSTFDRATEYKAFLLERVRYLYLAGKFEDFVTTCKVSAVALEFRAMLMVTGMERKSDPAAMLGVAYSVIPECRPFFSFEQVVSDAVEIRVLGKMQLLEAEMMGVLYTFLSKNDGTWFRESVDSMERAANLYWDKGILPDFMQFNTKKDVVVKTAEPDQF